VDKQNYSSVSPGVWLSVATTPFLLGLVTLRSLEQTLLEASRVSEEIFRGDRLPILHLPNSLPQNLDTED
jgi:hypothetical protein